MKVNTADFNCTGCASCANICPQNAIIMKQDNDGFYKPHIDEERCTNCGLCTKICPELTPAQKNTNTPNCYAVMADDETRAKSSSGGAFSVIAHEIFNRGGVVCGAAFDENWVVKHIIIDNENDMYKLRGSKYVQSFISEEFYTKIKKYLEEGRYVLFSGTPCQVAGLKNFLKKEYEKLLLIDFICSGNPSPLVFEKYLRYINFDNAKILKINFRDKTKNGWSCTHTTTTTTRTTTDNKFMHAFLSKSISCKSCGFCKYASVERVSDITIADFWSIERYKEHLNDKKGTSIYLANTVKANNLLEIIKSKFALLEEVPLNYAMQPVMKEPYKHNPRREKFLNGIKDKPFEKIYEKLLGNENNVAVMNFWYVPNRGAILTNYALNEYLNDIGYRAITVNYNRIIEDPQFRNNIADRFAKKYIKTTEYCPDYTSLKRLNTKIKTFIVGSDQVFRNWCVGSHNDKFFLNWVGEDAKKIACSASFGYPFFDGDNYSKIIMNKYLNRFDAISTREGSGVDILKNDYNIEATQIIDPVFYIGKEKYEKLIETSDKKETNFIAYYIMWNTPQKTEAINFAKEKLGIKTVDIKNDPNLEDWLARIKNCNLLITDSFHGTCFATMFKKNFISISPQIDGTLDDRIVYLLDMLRMENRQLHYPLEIYDHEEFLYGIEYKEDTFDLLNKEIERSKKWLINVLEKPKILKNYSDEDEVFYAMMDRINKLNDENKKIIKSLNNKILIDKQKELDKSNSFTKEETLLLLNKNILTFKYYYYRFISNFAFKNSKLKLKLKNKKMKYKEFFKNITKLENNHI